MGSAVSPAPAFSSEQSGPGEERPKRTDTDEAIRTGESNVKKPLVAATGASKVCKSTFCAIRVLILFGVRFPGDPHVTMQNVRNKDTVVIYWRSLQELYLQTLFDVAYWSSDGGVGGSGKKIMDVSGELHEHEHWDQKGYITITTPESHWTKTCTRRDDMMK